MLRHGRAVLAAAASAVAYAVGGLEAAAAVVAAALVADYLLSRHLDPPARAKETPAGDAGQRTEAPSKPAPGRSTASPSDDHALRRLSPELIQEALDRLPGVFYVLGPSGTLRHWNARFANVSGYSADELHGADPRSFFRGEDVAAMQDAVEEALETGAARVELDFITKSGETVPMLFTGERIELDGQPCLAGMGIDVSERRQRERDLEHSRRLLAKTAEVARVGGFLLNPEDDRLEWTDQMRHLVDAPPEYEPEVNKEWDFVPEEAQGRVRDELQRSLTTGEPMSFDMPIVTLRGERRRVRVSAETEIIPGSESSGDVQRRLWGVVQDVTATTRLQRLLEETERIADLGGWAYDPVDHRLLWTDHLAEMLPIPDDREGVPAESPGVLADWMRGFLDDEDAHDLVRAGVRATTAGTDFETEVPVVIRGDKRWMHLRCYTEPTGTGRHRLWGLVQDVTRRKRREERLQQAKDEAERAERLKTAFLANFSHEVRTPLTSMMGFSEILMEKADDDVAPFAERVYRSGLRLRDTVNAVLQLSRLEVDGLTLPDTPVSLNAAAEEAVSMMRPQAESKNVDLRLMHGPANAGASRDDEPGEASYDAAGAWPKPALDRILNNLIGNAIQYTPDGGSVQVRVYREMAEPASGGEERDCGVLVVEDTGPGIPESYRDDLFEPFARGPNQSDGDGTGLGLSIVRRVTHSLAGSIDVDTEEGEGTRFTVRLPTSTSPNGHDASGDRTQTASVAGDEERHEEQR